MAKEKEYNPFDDEALEAKEKEHQKWLDEVAEHLEERTDKNAQRVPLGELVKDPKSYGL